MEEPHFVKCEPQWPPYTEESPDSKADVRLHCGGPVDIKIEPYQMSDDLDILETVKEEFLPQDVKEEPSDDIDSEALPNELQSSLRPTIGDGNEPNSSESTGERSNDSVKYEDLRSRGQDSNKISDVPRCKVFPCKECEKIFPCQSALTMHVLVHTGERPFACNVCSRTFRQKGALKGHILRHEGDKRHVCPTCGKAFVERVGLRRHMTTHTGEKKYTCQICSKSYAHWTGLNLHRLTHRGEKAYDCASCGRTVLTKEARPQICPSCGSAHSLKSA